MDSAVESISLMPALICSEPEAMVPEMAITWLTMPWMFSTKRLKLADSWAISSLPPAVQARGQVALAFGDVMHALLDDVQGLDDGVAEQEGGREPERHHAQAQEEHQQHS